MFTLSFCGVLLVLESESRFFDMNIKKYFCEYFERAKLFFKEILFMWFMNFDRYGQKPPLSKYSLL